MLFIFISEWTIISESVRFRRDHRNAREYDLPVQLERPISTDAGDQAGKTVSVDARVELLLLPAGE